MGEISVYDGWCTNQNRVSPPGCHLLDIVGLGDESSECADDPTDFLRAAPSSSAGSGEGGVPAGRRKGDQRLVVAGHFSRRGGNGFAGRLPGTALETSYHDRHATGPDRGQ